MVFEGKSIENFIKKFGATVQNVTHFNKLTIKCENTLEYPFVCFATNSNERDSDLFDLDEVIKDVDSFIEWFNNEIFDKIDGSNIFASFQEWDQMEQSLWDFDEPEESEHIPLRDNVLNKDLGSVLIKNAEAWCVPT